jgi:hypothetical protein
MSRPAAFLAGILLVASVGCLQGTFLNRHASAGRYVRVVDGPPGRVASVLEAGFSGSGITVLVKRQEGEIRLVCQTKSGQTIGFFVRPDKAGAGKSTVTVNWDGKPDEDLWRSVVEWLATFEPQKQNEPNES